MKLRNLSFIWNLWPPFLGMGISIKHISQDNKKFVMALKKRFWNANYYCTQFGGGIFSMTDGVHMLMLVKLLRKKYQIWDKSADIVYLKRGLTSLTAEFNVTDEDIHYIQTEMTDKPTIDWIAKVDIKDTTGQVIAQVTRTLSIKHASK